MKKWAGGIGQFLDIMKLNTTQGEGTAGPMGMKEKGWPVTLCSREDRV